MKPSFYARLCQALCLDFYSGVLRGSRLMGHLRSLEKTQFLPREQLLELQRSRLRDLMRHAAEHVPFYRERFRKTGFDPDKAHLPENFQKLPLITKEDIRRDPTRFLAENHRGRTWRVATGGSTGVPLEVWLDREGRERRGAALKRGYGWAGYRDAEKTALVWGRLRERSLLKRTRRALSERLLRIRCYNAFSLDPEAMARSARDIRAFKPSFVIAYPSALYLLAGFIRQTGRSVPPARSVILGAEKAHPVERELIAEVFGCPVFQTYGCREAGPLAAECEERRGMHIHEENAYLEVIKDGRPAGHGEAGEIVVTDLTNYRMPLIRYKNDDLGVLSSRVCRCGRGLALLEDVQGRTVDMIRTPGGGLIHGEVFSHLVRESAGIRRFQVVQETLERVVVKIVREEGFSRERSGWLKEEMARALGPRMRISIEIVDEIPLTPLGKLRPVVSNVAPAPDGAPEVAR